MFIKVKRIESFIGMYSPMKIKINGEVIDKIKVKQEKVINVEDDQTYLQVLEGGRKSNTLKIDGNTEVIVENSILNYIVYIPVVILLILTLYIDMSEAYRAVAFAIILAIKFIYHFFVNFSSVKIS